MAEPTKTLRQLREEAGLTQLEVAVQLGVTITTVYNWERGAAEPSARNLLEIARFFNVSPFDIVLPEPKPKRPRGKEAA